MEDNQPNSDFPVIISYSNNGYYDFAYNMIKSIKTTCSSHNIIHFYCLDQDIYNRLASLSIPGLVLEMVNTSLSNQFENYGTQEYNKITHTKLSVLRDALSKYSFIHFIDSDVVCVREPTLEHYNKYKEYDIVFQYDCGMYSPTKLHSPTLHHIWCCMGNTTMRNTLGTTAILSKIEEFQHKYPNKNDQECLQSYFEENGIKDIRNDPNAKLYTYEIDEYTNGFWLNNNIGNLDKTYFFHANHVNGRDAKIKLLTKAGKWFLPNQNQYFQYTK